MPNKYFWCISSQHSNFQPVLVSTKSAKKLMVQCLPSNHISNKIARNEICEKYVIDITNTKDSICKLVANTTNFQAYPMNVISVLKVLFNEIQFLCWAVPREIDRERCV